MTNVHGIKNVQNHIFYALNMEHSAVKLNEKYQKQNTHYEQASTTHYNMMNTKK